MSNKINSGFNSDPKNMRIRRSEFRYGKGDQVDFEVCYIELIKARGPHVLKDADIEDLRNYDCKLLKSSSRGSSYFRVITVLFSH